MFKANASAYKVQLTDASTKSKPLTNGANKRIRFGRKFFSRTLNVAIVFMLAFFGLLSSVAMAPAARADPITDAIKNSFCSLAYFNVDPEDRGIGPNTADNMVNADKTISNYKITGYEKYGMAGLGWTVWIGPEQPKDLNGDGNFAGKQLVQITGGKNNNPLDKIDDSESKTIPGNKFYNASKSCGDMGNISSTVLANFVMSTTSWVVHLSNMIFQTAYESATNVLVQMGPTITAVVTGLKDGLYLPFLTLMVMISALWMAWKGLVKKASTEMAQGAIWMIGSAITGLALLLNPLFVSSVVDKVVSTVTESVITTLTSASTSTLGKQSLCEVDEAGNKMINADGSAPTSGQITVRGTVRTLQCTLWYSFMYQPWEIGQFGQTDAAPKTRTDYVNTSYGDMSKMGFGQFGDNKIPANIMLGKKAIKGNWALYQLDNKVNWPGANRTAQAQGMVYIAAFETNRSDPNTVWSGASSNGRITNAFLALIGALGAATMVILLSMEMIILQIGVIILSLLAPLFLLIGVHPGFGRKIALGWLETIAGLAMKRIILSILLAVMITFYSVVLSASASMDWLITMIMVIAISVGGIMYKKQILGMFNNINFGGNGGLNGENVPGANKARSLASKGASNLKSAVAGAVIGGAGNRVKKDKGNDKKDALDMARHEAASVKNGGEGAGGEGSGAGGRKKTAGSPDGPPAANAPEINVPGDSPEALEGLGGAGRRVQQPVEPMDGQGELFAGDRTEKDENKVRLTEDMARVKAREDARREIQAQKMGIKPEQNVTTKPINDQLARRLMVEEAQEEANRYNKRYDRMKPIRQTEAYVADKIDKVRGKKASVSQGVQARVEGTKNSINQAKTNAKAAVSSSAPVVAARRAKNNAEEATRDYHAIAKSNSKTYAKGTEIANSGKAAVARKYADQQKAKAVSQQKKIEEIGLKKRAKEIRKGKEFANYQTAYNREKQRELAKQLRSSK